MRIGGNVPDYDHEFEMNGFPLSRSEAKVDLGVNRLFHAPTRTTSSEGFMLHRTVHALWNLYGHPYKNRAEKEEETVT